MRGEGGGESPISPPMMSLGCGNARDALLLIARYYNIIPRAGNRRLCRRRRQFAAGTAAGSKILIHALDDGAFRGEIII